MSTAEQERCPLSDLLVGQCGCRKHRKAVVEVDVQLHHNRRGRRFGRAVQARYPGQCGGCDEPYGAGTDIRFDNAAQGLPGTGIGRRWWHDECTEGES